MIPTIAPLSSETARPFWSVMIPTYNCADLLRETLSSVLAQDPGPGQMQIEVVDDCSTKDDPEIVVNELGKGRVQFYRQPQNGGAIHNFNTCIERARGRWVHILHGDDTVLPGFYTRLGAAAEAHPEVGAVFCRHIYMDGAGTWNSLSELEREGAGMLEEWIDDLAIFNRIMFPSIVVKREAYEKLGGFNSDLVHTADWDMWKRVALHYAMWYDPQPLACYRHQHARSDTSRLVRTGLNIADSRRAIEIAYEYLPSHKRDDITRRALYKHARHAIWIAREMLRAKEPEIARIQIREAFKCSKAPMILRKGLKMWMQAYMVERGLMQPPSRLKRRRRALESVEDEN